VLHSRYTMQNFPWTNGISKLNSNGMRLTK
jgi:hypothetical protein